MVDKSVDLITISEDDNLVLHNSILENLFQNIECPIAILTVINDSENFYPLFLDLILRYFALNGKQDWNKSHYKWNSDSTQDITPGIRVWSKPLRLFEIYGNKYKKKEINVIVMENNISEEVSEEIKHKLIAFSIDISSNIIYNTNEDLIRSSLISLENSLKYTNYIRDIKSSFFFLVSDWKRKKPMNGFEGGKDYYKSILFEQKLDEINKKLEKYFGEINCFLMPGYKRSSQDSSLGLARYTYMIIQKYLEIDKINPKLHAFECIEKINQSIKGEEVIDISKGSEIAVKFSPENKDDIKNQLKSESSLISGIDKRRSKEFSDVSDLMNIDESITTQSKLELGSDINHLELYISQRKTEYISKFQPHLIRTNFLNCNYFKGIHANLIEDERRKFYESGKPFFLNESNKDLLLKNLNSKYKEIQSCQHVFIEFWNSTNREFEKFIYFGNNEIQKLLDKSKISIQKIEHEVESLFYISLMNVFNETCSIFISLNKDITDKEYKIAMKNSKHLEEKYTNKLMDEITNNSFDELALLNSYNEALITVCLRSLNAGLEFKDIKLKQLSEDYLKKKLDKAFKPIETHIINKIHQTITQESSVLYNHKNTNSAKSATNGGIPENLLNSHDSIENEVISIANSRSLEKHENNISENQIKNSFNHYNDEDNKRVKIEKPILAIDFGTCFVRYGYFINDNIQISRAFPNYVAFSGKDILIGEDAEKLARKQPENVIIHSKLFLGGPDLDFVKSKLYSFEIRKNNENFIEFLVNFDGERVSFKTEEIISLVLIKIKRDVELLIGTQLSECVITVPNSFNVAQREGMKSAAAIAGLKVKSLINDITAATIGYQSEGELKQKEIIIAHSGSNNFNIAHMRLNFQSNQDLKIENLYNFYALNCTGIAIDNVLMRTESKQKSAYYGLRKDNEKSKIELGDKSHSSLIAYNRQSLTKHLEIVDKKFQNFMEEMDRDRNVEKIVLIGGSFKFKNLFDLYPQIGKRNGRISRGDDEIIIRGATLYAHSLRKNKPENEGNIEIIEKLNSTISTKKYLTRRNFFNFFNFNDNDSKNIIPLNYDFERTPLPGQIEIRKDSIRESKVFLYQGENIFQNRYSNQYIGYFVIENHLKTHKFKVDIMMNCECIISLDRHQFEKFKLSDKMIEECSNRLSKIYRIQEDDDSNEKFYYSAVESIKDSNSLETNESNDKKEFMKFLSDFERDFMNTKKMGDLAKGMIINSLKNAKDFVEDTDNFNKEGIELHMKILKSTRNRFTK